jgi:hypothetical protein
MTLHAYGKFRITSRIRIYMQKGFTVAPLSTAQDECFDEEVEGRKFSDTIPLKIWNSKQWPKRISWIKMFMSDKLILDDTAHKKK